MGKGNLVCGPYAQVVVFRINTPKKAGEIFSLEFMLMI